MYVLLGVCVYYRGLIVALLLQPAAAEIEYNIEEYVVWCVYIIEGHFLYFCFSRPLHALNTTLMYLLLDVFILKWVDVAFLFQPAAAGIEYNVDVCVAWCVGGLTVALLLQPAAAGIEYNIEESVAWCVYIIEGRFWYFCFSRPLQALNTTLMYLLFDVFIL
jgi:hypothetical protein